ncbi:MAG: helix-turn-helix domain-containing protein [Deltaproteobacteria bacterium]|nr:helix-turn-helix domain-containing protein [Deltaproteobacteria bacterium]
MRPTTIAILGAKGGVGTSLFSANLAIYLATIGKRVLAVDADPAGSDLHSTLGVGPRVAPYIAPAPAFGAEDESLFAGTELDAEMVNTLPPREPVEGPVPGLHLMDSGLSEPHRGSARRSSLRELQGRLAKQDADFAVVDLGSTTTDVAVRFWCNAEHRLAVTMPEPNAVTGLYRLVRKAFAHVVLEKVEDEDDRNVLHTAFAKAGQTPIPADIAALTQRESPALGRELRHQMSTLEFAFIVNQARLRADLELGDQIAVAVRRRFGVHLKYLGYVEHDDAVRTASRKRRPLLLESPGSRASRNIEKIARRLFAAQESRRDRTPWREVPGNSHYDLLEVERGATDEEIRRAYKRMCAVFDPDNIVTFGLFDQEGLEAVRARIDEAHDVLLDPSRRRPYEISVFPEPPEAETKAEENSIPAGELPPAPTITPDTEFSGALLRAVRESQGTGLEQISERTKIGMNYLRCIEEDEFDELPAAVYVRGFVTEFAKCLKLDPEQVSQSYLRRYRAHLEAKA